MDWRVYAETHDGGMRVLATYRSREEANDYPIKLADWRRVWVEMAPSRHFRAPRPENLAKALATLTAAAAEGCRCPLNRTGNSVTAHTVTELTNRGEIRVYVYARNYRVIEILKGEHAGKRTAPPCGTWKPVYSLSAEGRRDERPFW